MNSLRKPKDFLSDAPNLPIRTGKRPITIRGPLHVQCNNHGDDRLLRQLVQEVANWPGIEARPFPVGSADLVSFRVGEDLATNDVSIFITGREFGRVLFGAPTIYLSLPLSCAHWTIVRGWAEPHFCCSFGLVPPGVMVIYTPRDVQEATVCRSLFRMSYTYALRERIDVLPSKEGSGANLKNSAHGGAGDFFTNAPEADIYLLKNVLHDWNDEEAVRILKRCRHAMRPGGRVIVIEMLLGELGEPGIAPLMDLNMMVLLTGRERTLAEYCGLLKDAGLRFSKSTPIRSPIAVIEARRRDRNHRRFRRKTRSADLSEQ